MKSFLIVVALAISIFTALPVRGGEKRHDSTAKPAVLRGDGVILVTVDPSSGAVTGARMLKSTGSKVMDDAAVIAFRKARFKRGTPARVEVPIHFTLTHPDI